MISTCVPEKLVLNLPWYIRTGVTVKTNDMYTGIGTDKVFNNNDSDRNSVGYRSSQTGTVLDIDRPKFLIADAVDTFIICLQRPFLDTSSSSWYKKLWWSQKQWSYDGLRNDEVMIVQILVWFCSIDFQYQCCHHYQSSSASIITYPLTTNLLKCEYVKA